MKVIVTVLLALLPIAAFAQQGTVTYTEAVKLNIELPPEMAEMAKDMPSSQTSTKALLFTESASLMKDAPAEEDEASSFEGHGDNVSFKMKFETDESEIYHNMDSGDLVEKRSFMGRTFRISGGDDNLQWKLTGEQSEFLGYACQKAIAMDDTVEVVAWFTPEIPVSAGPAEFFGLPGLVLVVDVDSGQRTYTATKVSLDDVDAGEIIPPKKGKKVTQEEFQEIFDEKMAEMDARDNGKNVHIQIVN